MKHLCFIFFLLYQILCEEPKYDMIVMLQSYSVENIGRSNRMYIIGQIATHYTPKYNSKWKIFSNSTDPIHFSGPFWLHFIDNNFHYLPFRFISANYSNFLNFSPSSLFVEGLNLFFVKNIQFVIKNIMKEDILIISEVTTFSREVYSTEFKEIKIDPQSESVLNLYVCPLRSGTFSTVVLISTNKGTFPYSLTYKSSTSPVDSFISTIFHPSSLMPVNITIKVPVVLQSKKVAVIYDSSILTPDKQTQTSMSYKFLVEKLNPGFYVSFLNFFSPTIGRNYPIFLSVSSKLLQSYYPVILFNTITNPSESIEMEVKMVNPTNLMIHIISVHLSSDFPSNVRISHTKPPLDCEPQSITLVGKIIMTGSRIGEVNTFVIVMYEVDGYSVQSIEIPVKGYVTIGSFDFPEEKIEIVGLINNTYCFHFFNNFKEAAFVLAAHIESDCFSIENFEVFIVNPNETSRDIIISFHPQKFNSMSYSIFDANKVDSILYIETNITRLIVPISGYNGNITLSKSGTSLSDQDSNKLTFNYSSILVNSERILSFYVTNPNPINFNINLTSDTQFIQLLSSSNIKIYNFSTQKCIIKIKFCNPFDSSSKSIQDTNINVKSNFYFLFGRSRFDIDIIWHPNYGEFQLKSSVYKIVFGLRQNISVNLKSTYKIPVFVKQIKCSTGYLIKNKNFLIDTGNDYELNRLEFIFDSIFLSKFNEMLDSSSVGENFELPIEYIFSLNDGYEIKSNMTIKFEYAYFPNKPFAFGLIPVNSKSYGNVTVLNFFDVPVVFVVDLSNLKEKVFIMKMLQKQTILPGNFFNLEFAYLPTSIGHEVVTIPIETNVTIYPFYIKLESEAIQPIFSFVNLNINEKVKKKKEIKKDIQKETDIDTRSFETENDKLEVTKDEILTPSQFDKIVSKFNISLKNSEPIEFSVFLKNEGSIPIPIEKLSISSKMHLKSKCGSILPSNSQCEIIFVINPKYLSHPENEVRLEVSSCNITKYINITVFADEETILHIKMANIIRHFIILIVTLLPIAMQLIEFNQKTNKTKREYNWRLAELNQEIEVLSVSKRSSVPIQTSNQEKKPFVGRWTCPDLFKISPVTKHGIDAMTRIIGNVK